MKKLDKLSEVFKGFSDEIVIFCDRKMVAEVNRIIKESIPDAANYGAFDNSKGNSDFTGVGINGCNMYFSELEIFKSTLTFEEAQEYAAFCIRCHEQGLPCLEVEGWLKL